MGMATITISIGMVMATTVEILLTGAVLPERERVAGAGQRRKPGTHHRHRRPGDLGLKVASAVCRLSCLGLAILAAAVPSHATAVNLDFSFSPALSQNEPIPQSYGDIPGQIDLVYSSVSAPGSSTPCFDPQLRFWDVEYSNLLDVAYACNGGTGQIKLLPLPGYQVTLQGFDLGAWPRVDRSSQVTVFAADLSTVVVLDPPPLTISGTLAKQYSFAGPQFTRLDGFAIQYGPDGFNVGIDNLRFVVSPVPAPLPLLGVAGLFAGSRNLRRRVKAVQSIKAGGT